MVYWVGGTTGVGGSTGNYVSSIYAYIRGLVKSYSYMAIGGSIIYNYYYFNYYLFVFYYIS
jgi:hypothetical protein